MQSAQHQDYNFLIFFLKNRGKRKGTDFCEEKKGVTNHLWERSQFQDNKTATSPLLWETQTRLLVVWYTLSSNPLEQMKSAKYIAPARYKVFTWYTVIHPLVCVPTTVNSSYSGHLRDVVLRPE